MKATPFNHSIEFSIVSRVMHEGHFTLQATTNQLYFLHLSHKNQSSIRFGKATVTHEIEVQTESQVLVEENCRLNRVPIIDDEGCLHCDLVGSQSAVAAYDPQLLNHRAYTQRVKILGSSGHQLMVGVVDVQNEEENRV